MGQGIYLIEARLYPNKSTVCVFCVLRFFHLKLTKCVPAALCRIPTACQHPLVLLWHPDVRVIDRWLCWDRLAHELERQVSCCVYQINGLVYLQQKPPTSHIHTCACLPLRTHAQVAQVSRHLLHHKLKHLTCPSCKPENQWSLFLPRGF